MPPCKQGVQCSASTYYKTHPVHAPTDLCHLACKVPPNTRLIGLRDFELFFSQYITDGRFELGSKLCTPVIVDVHSVDSLGITGVARRHSGGLTRIASLQTTSSVHACRTHCLKNAPWCFCWDGTSHYPSAHEVE